MYLKLKRIALKDEYTIGRLYVDGEYFCDTLEDKSRGLRYDMSLDEIQSIKVKGKTAIPTGVYRVTLDVVSPKFSKYEKYKSIDGKLPRLVDVPQYSGVLIHCGNTAKDTDGCILVGKNKVKGKVVESTETFFALYNILLMGKEKGIALEISE